MDNNKWADQVVLDHTSEKYPGFRVVILRLKHSRMYNGKILFNSVIIDSVRAHHDGLEVAHKIHDKLELRAEIERKKNGSGLFK